MRSDKGLSFVEATIIVAVMSLLTAVLAPSIVAMVDDSRQAKAREDVDVLATAMARMLVDIGEPFFMQDGNGAGTTDPPSRSTTNRVNMLVGNGQTPAVATARGSGTDWDSVLSATVTSFYSQLIVNTPAYRSPTQMSTAANFDPDAGATANNDFGWRGGYLAPIVGPDPWGQRYAANVEFLGRPNATTPSENDVFVISAGPNAKVDTLFESSATAVGFDDILVFVSTSVR